MAEQEPEVRVGNFSEVALGYTEEEAAREAERCLMCTDPTCISGCPVEIDIPGFIQKICDKEIRGAYDIMMKDNLLPAICGRVCPQEVQCEVVCTVADLLDEAGNVDLHRTAGDAGGIGAHQASLGLERRLVLGVAERDFGEVADANLGVLLGHRGAVLGNVSDRLR